MPPGVPPGLEASGRHQAQAPMIWANATHVCTCEVDVATGAVTLLRYIVSEDCGPMINPNVVEGQIDGGTVQGIGGALLEHLAYDADGNPVTTTFVDYLLPTIADVPVIEHCHIETPGPGPGGYKGVGEGGAIGAPPAVVNAVADAVRRRHHPPADHPALGARPRSTRHGRPRREAGAVRVPRPGDRSTRPSALLAELGDSAKVLAGGQSLVPMLALRLAIFEHLVDLRRVEELRAIERRNGTLWIGAGTTQATIERSAEVAGAVPLLARATPLIGHFQIRNRGTIGGSLAHADPAAEYPAVALALDAELEAQSPAGRRTIPASGFFHGTWTTELADDEVLVGVGFPVWEGRCGFAVEELARRHGDFALAGAVVAVQLDDDGGGHPLRDRAARPRLHAGASDGRRGAVLGSPAADVDVAEVGRAAVATLTAVPSDLHASAEYRTRVGATLVERAWNRAVAEALDA